MVSEAQKRAFKRYYRKNKGTYRVVAVRLHKEQDADVIAAIDEQPSKAEYIKRLVRRDVYGGTDD